MDFNQIPEELKKAGKLEHFKPNEAKEIYLDVERSTWNYISKNKIGKDSKDMKEAGLYLNKVKEAFERLNYEK